MEVAARRDPEVRPYGVCLSAFVQVDQAHERAELHRFGDYRIRIGLDHVRCEYDGGRAVQYGVQIGREWWPSRVNRIPIGRDRGMK